MLLLERVSVPRPPRPPAAPTRWEKKVSSDRGSALFLEAMATGAAGPWLGWAVVEPSAG